jgi:hypothetical protein
VHSPRLAKLLSNNNTPFLLCARFPHASDHTTVSRRLSPCVRPPAFLPLPHHNSPRASKHCRLSITAASDLATHVDVESGDCEPLSLNGRGALVAARGLVLPYAYALPVVVLAVRRHLQPPPQPELAARPAHTLAELVALLVAAVDALEQSVARHSLAFPNYASASRYRKPIASLDLETATLAPESASLPRSPSPTTADAFSSDTPLTTPDPVPMSEDDTAVRKEPSHHVDYLSYVWREEDIWSSWRHIVEHRKVYGERSRLENASWRTWAKSQFKLRTVSPDTLNW